MKILASRQYPTIDDYENSGEFDAEQLKLIRKAFDLKWMTPKKIKFIANPEYTADQMAQLMAACGVFTLPELTLVADPKFTSSQMYVVFQALNKGVPAEKIAKWATPECPKSIMRCLSMADARSDEPDIVEWVNMLASMDISDRARTNILDVAQIRSVPMDTLHYIQGLLDRGAAPQFIDGISWYIGYSIVPLACNLYKKFPEFFNSRTADQIDSVILGFESAKDVVRDMVDGKYSTEQVEVLLQCFEDLGEENMSENAIYYIADPTKSAQKMERARFASIWKQ